MNIIIIIILTVYVTICYCLAFVSVTLGDAKSWQDKLIFAFFPIAIPLGLLSVPIEYLYRKIIKK